jgi:hypothetical protein
MKVLSGLQDAGTALLTVYLTILILLSATKPLFFR